MGINNHSKLKEKKKNENNYIFVTAKQVNSTTQKNTKNFITDNEPFTQKVLQKAYNRRIAFFLSLNLNDHNIKDKMFPKENIDRLVTELRVYEEKKTTFSRRRIQRLYKNVDSINNRNANFNRKLARAFGQDTKEIKLNLYQNSVLNDF